MRKRVRIISTAVLAAAFLTPIGHAALGKAAKEASVRAVKVADPAPVTVDIVENEIKQKKVTVPVGGAVKWRNLSNHIDHMIISNGTEGRIPIFQTNVLRAKGTFLSKENEASITFDQPGTFRYHDYLNPGIRGTVVVK